MRGNVKLTTEINELVGSGYLKTRTMWDRVAYYNTLKADEVTRPHAEGRHRSTFGISSAGGCVRSNQLGLLGHEVTFTPGQLFNFNLGHYCEAIGYALLEGVGFKIEPQAEVKIPGDYEFPLFHSWTDGVAVRKDMGRVALSLKIMGMKGAGAFRGKVTRRGWAALPLEGPKPTYYVQSQLESYGLGLDKALMVVLNREWGPWLENGQDEITLRSGSSFVWTEVLEVRRDWVEKFVLPEYRRAQRELVETGEPGPGRQYDADLGVFVDIDPQSKNAVNGWNLCKWSTGQCDLYDVCKQRLNEQKAIA